MQSPAGRVARLRGASTEVIELALSPLPDDAPAMLTFRPPTSASAAEVVACALDELEMAATRLFPAWLPAAEHLEGPGGGGVPAVRALAIEQASRTRHFGPFLADLAEQALRERAARTRRAWPHPLRTRHDRSGPQPPRQAGSLGGGRSRVASRPRCGPRGSPAWPRRATGGRARRCWSTCPPG
ncbi:hypothetical protein ACFQZ4_39225 [Catellatospora coxensis]